MNNYLVKVKHIIPTLLYALIGTVGSAMLIRWIIFQTNVFELPEEAWSIWIPMTIPWIPITIWLRPKLRIIVRDTASDRLQFFFQLVAWFAIGIPLLVSQSFLNTAMGDLTEVTNVEKSPLPQQRFFTIKDYSVLSKLGGLSEDVRASGDHNEHLDINFYFAFPKEKSRFLLQSDNTIIGMASSFTSKSAAGFQLKRRRQTIMSSIKNASERSTIINTTISSISDVFQNQMIVLSS